MASSSSGGLTTPRFIRGAADRPTRLLRKTHAIDEDEGISPSGIIGAGSTVADELCLQSAGIGESSSTTIVPSVSFVDAPLLPKPEPVRSCSGEEIMNIGGIDIITNSWFNFANVDSTGLQNIGGLGGFAIKQFSTESTTSNTSSTGGNVNCSLLPPDVPRKSVIQDDIRMNRGRFQLVRKKGRSEVWNLFGQVLDTLTGQRLPYVACYACKVLYTDTGGGTGNMTRHRCPMGTSYRSTLASSSNESEQSNNQGSFDSTHNPPNGSMSPDNVNQISYWFETPFPTKWFYGSPSTTSAVRESPLAPVQQISLTSSSSGSGSGTLASVLHLSTENPSTSSYAFNETERQLFLQSLVRFCAQDMQNPDIVEGDGFRQLIETALCIGRSCQELPNYQELRTLIPSSGVVAEGIERHKSAAKKSTSADVALNLKDYGLALSCRQIQYEESIFVSFWVNYITEDWHLSRRVLSVNKWPQSNDLSELVYTTLEDYGFLEAKKIYITLDRFTQKNARLELSQKLTCSTSIVDVIDEILAQVFMQCRSTCDVEKLSEFCVGVIEMLARLNLLSLLTHKLPASLTSQRALGPQSYALFLYPLLLYVRQQFPQIQYFLEANADSNARISELAKDANGIDWSHVNDIETFLEPFHETVQIFTDNKLPHYHKLFPEWFALIHECTEVEDDEMSGPEGQTASKGSPFLVGLRYAANVLLKKWSDENMLIEHHMATVLNPRLKHLPVICSDVQRTSIYNHIRSLIGCAKLKKERSCETPDGEPPRKRRNFLISLEDSSSDEDELGCYLRTSFSTNQTKDILEFWSSIGEAQFPRLARLARFLLASAAAAPAVQLQVNDGKLTEKNLHNLLLLRSAYGL
uniref:BED-type domain-containing protein n=1 Tax=Steinernema glaseri TaxID=37863 RepID=A0A1I8ASV8_9BILA